MNVNNKDFLNKLNKEKKNMGGPLTEEKEKLIDYAKQKLDDLRLDLTLVENMREMVHYIMDRYQWKYINSPEWKKYQNLKGRDWVEKISNAEDKEKINAIHECLLFTITDFGAKETEKFREVTKKIKDLREETYPEGGEIDKNKVSQLISELQPLVTTRAGSYPGVSNIFFHQINSAIKTAEWRMGAGETAKTTSANSWEEKNQTTSDEKANVNEEGKDGKDESQLDKELNQSDSQNEVKETDFSKDISEKSKQKNEEKQEKIASILSEAKNETDPDKLVSLLEQVEKESGGNEISEQNSKEVGELKEKLLNSDTGKQKIIDKVSNSLLQNGLSKEDLDEETKKELESLKNEESSPEIIKKEESLTEKIGVAGAKKKLDEMMKRARGFLEKNLFDKVREVKKEVVQFISNSGYNNKVYLVNKSEIEQFFAQAENLNKGGQPQESSWKKAIIPVSLSLGAIAVVIMAVMIKKRSQNKFKKLNKSGK